MWRRTALRAMAGLGLAFLLGCCLSGFGLFELPLDTVRVRIRHERGDAPTAQTVRLHYGAPGHDFGVLPRVGYPSLDREVAFVVDGDSIVADISTRRLSPSHVWGLGDIDVDGLSLALDLGTPRELHDGIGTTRVFRIGAPSPVSVPHYRAQEVVVVIDDTPPITTNLTAPTDANVLPAARTGDLAAVSLCHGASVALRFTIEPWPQHQEDIQAILVTSHSLLEAQAATAREAGLDGPDGTHVQVPVLLSREAWTRLAPLALGGAYDTPNLTLERGNHTATLWGPPQGHEQFVALVGVFTDDRAHAIFGAIRVEIAALDCPSD